MKIELANTKSVKCGSTDIKKIMQGTNRIWPLWPITLLENGVYYTVTGIQNGEYVKSVIPDIECTLVSNKSSYFVNIVPDPNVLYNIEFCGTCLKDNILSATGGGDTYNDIETFLNNYQTSLYYDYLASSFNGWGFDRLNVNVGNSITTVQTDNVYIARFTAEPRAQNSVLKRIILKYKDSDTNLYEGTKSAYRVNTYASGREFYACNKNTDLIIYYIKVWDNDENVLAFLHFKEKDGNWTLYDEVSKSFCDYRLHNNTYNLDDLNVGYTNKTISCPPLISEYYTSSGYITDGDDLYERLVNNKTGNVMKGIKMLATVEFSTEPDVLEYWSANRCYQAGYQAFPSPLTMTVSNCNVFSFGIMCASGDEGNITVDGHTLDEIAEYSYYYNAWMVRISLQNPQTPQDIEIIYENDSEIIIIYNFK